MVQDRSKKKKLFRIRWAWECCTSKKKQSRNFQLISPAHRLYYRRAECIYTNWLCPVIMMSLLADRHDITDTQRRGGNPHDSFLILVSVFFFSFFNFLSSIEPSFLPVFLELFECISNWINLTGISLSYSTRVPWIRPIQLMDRDWNSYCT